MGRSVGYTGECGCKIAKKTLILFCSLVYYLQRAGQRAVYTFLCMVALCHGAIPTKMGKHMQGWCYQACYQ